MLVHCSGEVGWQHLRGLHFIPFEAKRLRTLSTGLLLIHYFLYKGIRKGFCLSCQFKSRNSQTQQTLYLSLGQWRLVNPKLMDHCLHIDYPITFWKGVCSFTVPDMPFWKLVHSCQPNWGEITCEHNNPAFHQEVLHSSSTHYLFVLVSMESNDLEAPTHPWLLLIDIFALKSWMQNYLTAYHICICQICITPLIPIGVVGSGGVLFLSWILP